MKRENSIVVKTPTEKIFTEIQLKVVSEIGGQWSSGCKRNEVWGTYKSATCIRIYRNSFGKPEMQYCDIDSYIRWKFKIIQDNQWDLIIAHFILLRFNINEKD